MKYFWTKTGNKKHAFGTIWSYVNDASICDQLRTMFVHPAS